MGCCAVQTINAKEEFEISINQKERLIVEEPVRTEKGNNQKLSLVLVNKESDKFKDISFNNLSAALITVDTVTKLNNVRSRPKLPSNLRIRPSLLIERKNLVREGKVSDYYKFEKLVGQGGFGKVYQAKQISTGLIRAIKIIRRITLSEIGENQLADECSILKDTDHPNIVKLFEIFADYKHYFLVTEYCPGGELFDRSRYVKNISEIHVSQYIKQILSALKYCHHKGIVHRDLKPENIMFDSRREDSNLKVIDFGASEKLLEHGQLFRIIGTPIYIAPEVLSFQGYNEKCDLWSVGVIMYTKLKGRPPFYQGGTDFQQIKNRDLLKEDWSGFSTGARDLLKKLLVIDPKDRISADEAFIHPWIQDSQISSPLGTDILNQLLLFDAKNKLCVAIKQFIAIRIFTEQDHGELMKAFKQLDVDGDGTLTKEEFQAVCSESDSEHLSKLMLLFEELDVNESGGIDYVEFISAAMKNQSFVVQEKLRAAFKLFDVNQDGFISKDEIGQVFKSEVIEDLNWMDLLNSFDTNQDGRISLEEFLNLITAEAQIEI